MGHDVYICYDEKDQITADAICHVLEDNKIKCWLKTRDLGVSHMVEGIMEAINQARVVVLIFSSNSKHSNFVNTEVDIAFTENIPILVFKIDESKLDGGLEFFLNNKHWLDAYPDPEIKFESLIKDTSKLLGEPISKPVINNKKTMIDNEAIKKEIEDNEEPVREVPKPFDVPVRRLSDSGEEILKPEVPFRKLSESLKEDASEEVEPESDDSKPFDTPVKRLSDEGEEIADSDVPKEEVKHVKEPIIEIFKPEKRLEPEKETTVKKSLEPEKETTVKKSLEPEKETTVKKVEKHDEDPGQGGQGGSFISRFKIPIIIGVIALIAVGAFAFMTFNDGGTADIPSNVTLKISDFHVDDVNSGSYNYVAVGSISPQPSDAENYVIASYFYDNVGNLVNSTQVPLKDAKTEGKGIILGSASSSSKNIVRVEVKLMTKSDIIVTQGESQL